MSSVAINSPKTPVTKGSNGIAAATVPNVCKMPGPPAPFVPTPLPNIGKSDNSPDGYSTTVKIEGNPVAIQGASFKSMGDVASQGTGGGLVSNNTQGATKFIGPGSLNVKIEGKNVQLLGDQMMNNCGPSGSPPNAATMEGLLQSVVIPGTTGSPETCPNCKVASGRTKSDARPYNEFFSDAERAELAAIEAANPEFGSLLPPKTAHYQVRATPANKAARAKYEAAKKKAGLKGEYAHPHAIKAGGCPIHQQLARKPDQDPDKSTANRIDDQIQAIVNRAIVRNTP